MDLGARLTPLSKIEDIQRIIQYSKILPDGVPNRYFHISKLLNISSKTELSISSSYRVYIVHIAMSTMSTMLTG